MAIAHDVERHEIDTLLALTPAFAGCRVLEIGCGNGRLTRRYSATAGSVLAIDPDPTAIAELHADPPPGVVDARAIGIEQIALADASVDRVIFAWSL
jgi:16S rRNA A1518/A1519 N6-dimethyltransferase RsmA/KsgA/DIM1 with predicted DNA glycosylase/AP lyase activity